MKEEEDADEDKEEMDEQSDSSGMVNLIIRLLKVVTTMKRKKLKNHLKQIAESRR